MFYMATAALQKQSLAAKSHKGTLRLFAEHFIKTGILPRESLTDFRNVFDERLLAEYDADFSFSQQEAEQILDKASRFAETVATHIASFG